MAKREYLEETVESYIVTSDDMGETIVGLEAMDCWLEYELLPFDCIAVDIREHRKDELASIDGVRSVEVEGRW